MPLFGRFWPKKKDDESSGEECEDKSADDLSYVGEAVYNVLRRHHNHHHHELWNVTKGKIVGDLQFTPRDAFTRMDRTDPVDGHDDWFPKAALSVMRKTQVWCDVLSLAPPDGKFMVEFKDALREICENQTFETSLMSGHNRITVRMMFGNIVGMPVNCNRIIKELTKDLPPDAKHKLKLWVGSWRKDVSWNHAKIIAVDGKYLWTGGHNFWDPHYLQEKPVNDLSLEMEGGVARDAHRFANAQWGYVVKKQSTAWGRFVDKNVGDYMEVPRRARVTVSDFPETNAAEFPPYYKERKQIMRRSVDNRMRDPDYVPCITMGRYGALLKKARPSDDGIEAMLKAAKVVIRMAIQDLGPVPLPGTKQALPGLSWPHVYLKALALAIWERAVDVEIVLSNPGSIPGNLSPTEACYGNGWSCVDVAAEIIKTIRKMYPSASDSELRVKVQDNLRVCFLRSPEGGRHYKDGQTLGLHSKHFIVDDICCYIGSQNLYICDLAEWGVVIDDREKTQFVKGQYWDPMWKTSYKVDDCEVDKVMDGLEISREADNQYELTVLQYEQAKQKLHATATANIDAFNKKIGKDDRDGPDSSESDGEE
ncbi:Inherit from NOG: PLDc [Seminavis robusta]|uniref:Inherit from NOG: PLDc n=1 Tax=Seminavis robusta TaxID=568900 RepID=A0A9N8DXT7_9STRA|nr:Inherit from NOG: PLDc [Seminavis robusta]|eukprot:Sro458_g147150.1 Inherit from NOG: PLDc (593) ;mRNA; f:44586-46511